MLPQLFVNYKVRLKNDERLLFYSSSRLYYKLIFLILDEICCTLTVEGFHIQSK